MLIPCHDGDMGAVPKASNGWVWAREIVLASGSDVPLQYEDECSTTTIYLLVAMAVILMTRPPPALACKHAR